jgi:hypothetical protein
LSIFGSPDIENLKEQKDIKGLIKVLRKNDPNIVLEAALALAELGVYNPTGLVLGSSHSDWQLRKRTYMAYSGMTTYGFIPLVVSLHDPHESVRAASVTAFLLRKDNRAFNVLGNCLLNDPSSLVREIIIPVLVRLDREKSYGYLLSARNDTNNQVSKKAEAELTKHFPYFNSSINKGYPIQNFGVHLSLHSIWENLRLVLSDDYRDNHSKFFASGKYAMAPYDSPIGNSCRDWMVKVGSAIIGKNEKDAHKYLWNIERVSQQGIDSPQQLNIEIKDLSIIKPYIEYNQTSKLLLNSVYYSDWFK